LLGWWVHEEVLHSRVSVPLELGEDVYDDISGAVLDAHILDHSYLGFLLA